MATSDQLHPEEAAARARWARLVEDPGPTVEGTGPGGRQQLDAGFSPAALNAAIEAHHLAQREQTGRVLKGINQSWVTRIPHPDGPGELAVKEERSRRRSLVRRILTPSRPLQAFQVGRRLLKQGLPTPLPLAATAGDPGYLVTRYLPGTIDLRSLLIGWSIGGLPPEPVVRSLARQLGWWVRWLHSCGVYQGDLKINNILVRPTGETEWGFYLLDLDRVYLHRRVTPRRQRKNLAQLGDLPRGFTAAHGLTFLRAYLGPGPVETVKKTFRRVAREVARRQAERRQRTPRVHTIDDYIRHQLEEE